MPASMEGLHPSRDSSVAIRIVADPRLSGTGLEKFRSNFRGRRWNPATDHLAALCRKL